jgi:3'(2'), 5'-bisphosphate nucleotidase
VQTVHLAGSDRHLTQAMGDVVADDIDVVASGYARSDHLAAAELAGRAGALLAELQQGDLEGKALGAEGDRRSHELLTAVLAERFPKDRVRSEEDDQSEALVTDVGRVWIIDPLDGTREYSERRDDWAVHVALAVHGAPAVGAVALPGLGLVLGTGSPPPLPALPPTLRLVVSRTRPPEFVPFVAERLGAETVPMGSAGAKISAVVRGEAEIYVHAGGQYEWDSCAPVAVALAAGLHASRIDGSPLRYARPDPWLPDLVVCHPALADAVLAAVRDSGIVDGA